MRICVDRPQILPQGGPHLAYSWFMRAPMETRVQVFAWCWQETIDRPYVGWYNQGWLYMPANMTWREYVRREHPAVSAADVVLEYTLFTYVNT